MSKKGTVQFLLANPQAAGIDVGSRSHWVCCGEGKEKTRQFGVFTSCLHEMAQWLESNGVKTVAMESTGFYWKPLFLVLQAYGFEVLLVNATQTKNVQGRKSDLRDCQWIWQLHSVGFLSASFQPDAFTEELRAYTRHRKSLIEGASRYVSKMQKALTMMNLQLPAVLTDITGKSGRAIIEAILSGERDGKKLAELADSKVKAPKERIAEALTGWWHEQYLFELGQCWELYEFHQRQIGACDRKIESLLAAQAKNLSVEDLAYEPKKKKRQQKNDPQVAVGQYAYQLSEGVDLLEVEGIGVSTLLTLLAEVGLDLSKFPSEKHFVSWLALCPNKKVTGGKVLSSKTRKNTGRLSQAFRQAANAAGNQKGTSLSDFFRHMAYRKGRKMAITATARKIAIITYQMLRTGRPYEPPQADHYRESVRQQKLKQIQKAILNQGIKADELTFA